MIRQQVATSNNHHLIFSMCCVGALFIIRMDVLKILMYRQDMPEGCTMGARHSKWDVITILPSSSSEAASWENANICMQLLQA